MSPPCRYSFALSQYLGSGCGMTYRGDRLYDKKGDASVSSSSSCLLIYYTRPRYSSLYLASTRYSLCLGIFCACVCARVNEAAAVCSIYHTWHAPALVSFVCSLMLSVFIMIAFQYQLINVMVHAVHDGKGEGRLVQGEKRSF